MADQAPKPDRDTLLSELSALTATATSADGAVSLSVNTDGVMTGLRLTDAVSRMSPAEIADAVLRTYVEAQRDSAKRTGQLLAPLGSGGYLMDRLRWRVQYEPAPPVVAPARVEPDGAVLKDRSEETPADAPPSGPSTDDDWYGKGMRFEPTW
ncbi:YbaB/EbfC family nucleoid-associated protein [Amycolatopsis sp. NPDC088138]|uniref:YbaB/EbfC family nucleoid-associated protein n=1 Tax=Amycolatopsis sp. NPDC088138 TaxID=3363938 RepID=UPI00380DAC09